MGSIVVVRYREPFFLIHASVSKVSDNGSLCVFYSRVHLDTNHLILTLHSAQNCDLEAKLLALGDLVLH